MSRPVILDMFCGAGGAGMGYFLAGFDVVGVDISPQPDYPFRFIQADVTKAQFRWDRFDAVHASPPCQRFSVSASIGGTRYNHPNLIGNTRKLLRHLEIPYVIENVPGAPLRSPFILCGSMFGLQWSRFELKRHRLFETNWPIGILPKDRCGKRTAISVFGNGGVYREGGKDRHAGLRVCNQLMGTYWIRQQKGVSQAIPPIYTALIGKRLKRVI